MAAPVSIVIPTRGRPAYLEGALDSVAGQAHARGAEILVVDDGSPEPQQLRALAARHGVRYEAVSGPGGLNAARNLGVERSDGELIAFLDDDIRAEPGWLTALEQAAAENPGTDVFAGRIRASLEGPAPRSCGREQPPVTTLDLGEQDRPTAFAWGANMAIRRSALRRVGRFQEDLHDGGDEQELQERLQALEPSSARRSGALYVARAGVIHRRLGNDARLRALARTAYIRGQAARRFDAGRGRAPSMARELLTLAGCIGHVFRRRCPAGLVMAAHSAGRLQAALAAAKAQDTARTTTEPGPADDFLSGSSGTVGGLDSLRRRLADSAIDAVETVGGRRRRLARAASLEPPRRSVLVLGVERPELAVPAAAIRRELLRSRHRVELHTLAPEGRGRFENLNLLLADHPPQAHDWLLVVDDDIVLPAGFLDRFLFLCERFSLALAQPAHRLDSHAAWDVTRRRPRSLVRETAFVEIGPLTAFSRASAQALTPFPDLQMGWGLDLHWAALARQNGWRCGVVDALAIGHRIAPAASAYAHETAIAEARCFLSGRPYLTAQEAQQTRAVHRRW